jgi:crotonobetainyl-CoA:carnitine CoA-transferase CaiB-like acyl-CoA transferase
LQRFNYKRKIRIKKQGSNYKEFVEGKIKDADGLFEALDKARLKRLGIDNENIKRRKGSKLY